VKKEEEEEEKEKEEFEEGGERRDGGGRERKRRRRKRRRRKRRRRRRKRRRGLCYHIPRPYSYSTSLLVCWTPPAVAARLPAQPACLPPGLWLTATSPDRSHTDALASEPHCRERQMKAMLFMNSFVPRLATHSLS